MKDKRCISDDYFEYLLKQALDEIAEEEGAKLQEELEEIEEVEFSIEYYKAIDDITNKRKRRRRFKYIKAAIIVFFVFCGGLTFAYNADADVRVFINKLFVNRGTQLDVGDTPLPLEYDFSEIPEIWEEFYVPEYMPAGYRVEQVCGFKKNILIYYTNGEKEIVYEQIVGENMSYSYDLEHTYIEDIKIKKFDGLFIAGEKNNKIIWNQKGHKFMVDGEIEKEELVIIAESLKIINRL